MEKKKERKDIPDESTANPEPEKETSSSKSDWLADKEKQAEKRRLERAHAEVETRIADLEVSLSEIDEALSDPAVGTDLPKLTELTNQRNTINSDLDEAMTEWETLSEQLESLQ